MDIFVLLIYNKKINKIYIYNYYNINYNHYSI